MGRTVHLCARATIFLGCLRKYRPLNPFKGADPGEVADSVTTDHISPAGAIAKDSPAAQYLRDHGISEIDFNSYGSRRGNDRVMTRGTFANIRLRNELALGTEGGWTTYYGPPHGDLSQNEVTTIHAASMAYQANGIPLVVIAGTDYGMGSSRDWAAKGTFLLGVRLVIAESYERIHRSNLVGMGVLPLQFKSGEGRDNLGIVGTETLSVDLDEGLEAGQTVIVHEAEDGRQMRIETICRWIPP